MPSSSPPLAALPRRWVQKTVDNSHWDGQHTIVKGRLGATVAPRLVSTDRDGDLRSVEHRSLEQARDS